MSPKSGPRPLHREPLVVALVLLNLSLGAALLHKEFGAPKASGLPAGHPDVAVPAPLLAPQDDQQLPPGHPDISGGEVPEGVVPPMAGATDGGVAMSPELAAIAAAAKGGTPAAAFSVHGTVKVSAKMTAAWPAGSPVFVIAKPESGGPPFAVRRYDGVKAPFAYALGPDNIMMAGTNAPRKLVVSVRVDQDGDAMTRQPGDLEGGPSAPVSAKGAVDVTVDRPAVPNR